MRREIVRLVQRKLSTVEPSRKPTCPNFSSGPCAKRPGWSPEIYKAAATGRSHRSKLGKKKLKDCIEQSKALLGVPADYKMGIVPASDTGAIEMALWSMLGPRDVDVCHWESFGKGWFTDIQKQLKLTKKVREFTAEYGELPDLKSTSPENDIIFTFNGTTSGVRVPNLDWISADRQGLTFNDATSAVFAMDVDWTKCDVTTYSWQKVLGGEAAHGVLVLSPRAIERLESFTPPRPLPKIFQLTKKSKLIDGIFDGATINTPSMIAVEDCLDALNWAESIGGLPALINRSNANLAVIDAWVTKTPWANFLAKDSSIRSNTSVCLTLDADPAVVQKIVNFLEADGIAFDIGSYRDAPPGLRIWCGATVESHDLSALLPWIDFAFQKFASS